MAAFADPFDQPVELAPERKQCLRCGRDWVPRFLNPKSCPSCGSAYWNTPPLTRRGRRPGDPLSPSRQLRKLTAAEKRAARQRRAQDAEIQKGERPTRDERVEFIRSRNEEEMRVAGLPPPPGRTVHVPPSGFFNRRFAQPEEPQPERIAAKPPEMPQPEPELAREADAHEELERS